MLCQKKKIKTIWHKIELDCCDGQHVEE